MLTTSPRCALSARGLAGGSTQRKRNIPSETGMSWLIRVVGWRLLVVLLVCAGSRLRVEVSSGLQVVHRRCVSEIEDGIIDIGRSLRVRKLRCTWCTRWKKQQ